MTPQEIALEAAEQIANWLGDVTESDRQHIAAIILTAAAKMVKESGAVEALEQNRDSAIAMKDATGTLHGKGSVLFHEAPERIRERACAALAKLRSITQ